MNHKPRCETDQSFLQVEHYCSLSVKGNERNNELSSSNERPEAKRNVDVHSDASCRTKTKESGLKLFPLVHLKWYSPTEFTQKQHPKASSKAVGGYLYKYIRAQDGKQCAPPLMRTPYLVCLSCFSSSPK